MFKKWFHKHATPTAEEVMAHIKSLNDVIAEIDGINSDDKKIMVSLSFTGDHVKKIPDTELIINNHLQDIYKDHQIQIISTVKKMATKEPPKKITKPAPTKPVNILPHVKQIIAVASGKGGVGKSTLASNLAVTAAKKGLKIGLLDADIYGPSIPTMFGIDGKPDQTDDGQIKPFTAHGIDIMSIGFMVDKDAPMIWRGPMVQSALLQLMRDVAWGSANEPLDILFIDMPPGTGDAQLTLAQKVPLSGAIIVSTPQDIALIDARKGLKMFEQTKVPILGIVENMAFHTCSSCGHIDHIFGENGAKDAAIEMGVPFLGAVPLIPSIRLNADQGTPASLNDSDINAHYKVIIDNALNALKNTGKKPPIIEIVD